MAGVDKAEHSSPLLYLLVYVVLMVLAGISVLVWRADLGAAKLPLALAIAFVKGALVVLFFMHLWQHRGASRLTMAVALVFIALLMSLAIADPATRLPITNPPTARRARDHLPPLPLPEQRVPNQAPGHQPVAP